MLASGILCTATREVLQDALPPIPQCSIDERTANPGQQGCKRKRDDDAGVVAVQKPFTVQVLHYYQDLWVVKLI